MQEKCIKRITYSFNFKHRGVLQKVDGAHVYYSLFQKRVVNGEHVNDLSDISRSKSVLRERLEYDILLVLKACCAKGNLYMYIPRSKHELEEM